MSQDSSRPSTQPRPTGTPRAVSEHRELLLGGARGFPWTLVLGALVTTLVIILSFKLASLLPTFALNPELLWLLKLSLLVLLTVLLIRFKARSKNAILEFDARGPIELRSGVHGATSLRDLRTLAALGAATNSVVLSHSGAISETERQRRHARAKRSQATELIKQLPQITIPDQCNIPGSPGVECPPCNVEAALCSICLSALSDEQCTSLPCSHMFHHGCICNWLLEGTGRNLRCPLCNHVLDDVAADQYDADDEENTFDSALVADWMVTAAQHAFIMQMAASVRDVLDEEQIDAESEADDVDDLEGGAMTNGGAGHDGWRDGTLRRDRTNGRRRTITPYGAAAATAYFGAAAAVAAAAGVLPAPQQHQDLDGRTESPPPILAASTFEDRAPGAPDPGQGP